jgi:26S proteasome regulatory subunit N3
LYDQAEKLVSKSVFPEQANNNEWARYLYYTGEQRAQTTKQVSQAHLVQTF